jgi:hypothetical protein
MIKSRKPGIAELFGIGALEKLFQTCGQMR